MSQIRRYHTGTMLVPVAALDAVDWMFAVGDGDAEEFGLYPCEALHLERFVTVPQMGRSRIPLSAAAVSDARNVLDGYTLSSECTNLGRDYGTPIGSSCDFCVWCQALVVRDWLDMLFDQAGFTPPAYCGHVGYRPDLLWAHLYGFRVV